MAPIKTVPFVFGLLTGFSMIFYILAASSNQYMSGTNSLVASHPSNGQLFNVHFGAFFWCYTAYPFNTDGSQTAVTPFGSSESVAQTSDACFRIDPWCQIGTAVYYEYNQAVCSAAQTASTIQGPTTALPASIWCTGSAATTNPMCASGSSPAWATPSATGVQWAASSTCVGGSATATAYCNPCVLLSPPLSAFTSSQYGQTANFDSCPKFNAFRAFLMMGLIFAVLSSTWQLVLYSVAGDKQVATINKWGLIFGLLSGITGLISMAIFVAKFNTNGWQYGWSFGVSLAAWALIFISAPVFYFLSKPAKAQV